MKFLLFASIVLLMNLSASFSADFKKGVDEYNKQNYLNAFTEWMPLAKKGNIAAQYNIGRMFYLGQGVPKDYNKAIKWFELSAKKGYSDAQVFIGNMYDRGHGVLKNFKVAAKWFKIASEQNNAMAQSKLGVLYLKGEGVIKDQTKAYMWFNISAANGNETSAKIRDLIEKKMSSDEISFAQKLSRECIKKQYKNC